MISLMEFNAKKNLSVVNTELGLSVYQAIQVVIRSEKFGGVGMLTAENIKELLRNQKIIPSDIVVNKLTNEDIKEIQKKHSFELRLIFHDDDSFVEFKERISNLMHFLKYKKDFDNLAKIVAWFMVATMTFQ